MSNLMKVCRVCAVEKPCENFRERMLRGAKIRIGTCRDCESDARKRSAERLSAAEVRALFDYNPATGEIRWKTRNNAPKFRLAGQIAGTRRRDGRGVIVHKGGFFLTSRIAWAYMTGHWPEHLVDHIDNNPGNDAWANLRAATKSQNGFNKRKKPRTSSRFKGVHFAAHANKWRAEIAAGGERIHLGYFDTEQEAAAAYAAAAESAHGEYARLA